MIITDDIIKLVCNRKVTDFTMGELVKWFNHFFPSYEINTKLRIASFIAQAAHETNGFLSFVEYGGKTKDAALKYFSRYEIPSRIAFQLGNTEKGDGIKYIGRGIFQLSGKRNYYLYGKRIGVDLISNPSLAETIDNATHIACEYWKINKLNELSDMKLIGRITKSINGGLNGIENRESIYNKLIEYMDKAA